MAGTALSSLSRSGLVRISAQPVQERYSRSLCSSDIFDGTMVVLAVYTLIIFHPGRLLYSQSPAVGTVTVAVGDKEKGTPELS